MEQTKWLIIGDRFFKLVSDDGEVWRLYWPFHQKQLQAPGAHYLDYWRIKGVIESE